MGMISEQQCNECGKEFQEWSCDHCYTKSMIKRMG
jgi:hypothetical protein